MQFKMTKEKWEKLSAGEDNCYLLTNGLGGFHSLSVIGSLARGDQALLMGAKKAPNIRFHFLSNLLETFSIDDTEYCLMSQQMAEGPDYEGFHYLKEFSYEIMPRWVYEFEDVKLVKEICMLHEKNQVGIRYSVQNAGKHKINLNVIPLLRFTLKNDSLSKEEAMNRCMEYEFTNDYIAYGEDKVYFQTNGNTIEFEATTFGPMFFAHDKRDGRNEMGYCNEGISFSFIEMSSMEIIFSANEEIEMNYTQMEKAQGAYVQSLLSMAKPDVLKSSLGRQLLLGVDAYVSKRDSIHGMTILAGYPFFEDWGRDTMISLAGTTLVAGRLDMCKSILRTFAKYEKKGLLPNLFPEGDCNPMYNSVDAPLLFINSVYDYYQETGDFAFVDEMWKVLADIIAHYEKGTDFHIGMDEDYLIKAGADLEQLTWMDVRVGDYLPTPRHGKPVEINAYWYNDMCVMSYFASLLHEKKYPTDHSWVEKSKEFEKKALRIKEAYLKKFWNEEENCLKDVLSGNKEENQIRCNQIWALTMPFTMLPRDKEIAVVKKVKEELYTTVGLRTLSMKDADFHDIYIGDMVQRDSAYHQGTVWAYPLGAYYRAVIRLMKEDASFATRMQPHMEEGMKALEDWLGEGCLGHLAEIYDGKNPTVSRGCFAQAWSDAELLRAVTEWEAFKNATSVLDAAWVSPTEMKSN